MDTPTTPVEGLPWPDELRRASRERDAPAGAVLARTNTVPKSMYYVLSGELQLVRHGLNGQPLVLQRVRRGWAAEASLFSPRYHCDLQATVPSRLVEVRLAAVQKALATSPHFAAGWIQELSAELRRLRARCERLGMRRAEERIEHAIELDGRRGTLELAGSLKDWAAELGLTHEALYRGLARLERAGRLVRQGKTLTLKA